MSVVSPAIQDLGGNRNPDHTGSHGDLTTNLPTSKLGLLLVEALPQGLVSFLEEVKFI